MSVAPVRFEYRVRYADTDQMGVVYYANYLRLFEIGRAEWLRARGRSYRDIEAAGVMLPVVEAHAHYRLPARYEDLLAIETAPDDLRAASVRFAYVIRRVGPGPGDGAGDSDGADPILAEGYTRHACMSREGRAVRWPADLAALLRGQPDKSGA